VLNLAEDPPATGELGDEHDVHLQLQPHLVQEDGEGREPLLAGALGRGHDELLFLRLQHAAIPAVAFIPCHARLLAAGHVPAPDRGNLASDPQDAAEGICVRRKFLARASNAKAPHP
jgi:hypothetical protein